MEKISENNISKQKDKLIKENLDDEDIDNYDLIFETDKDSISILSTIPFIIEDDEVENTIKKTK